jgi:hypothetical protein
MTAAINDVSAKDNPEGGRTIATLPGAAGEGDGDTDETNSGSRTSDRETT